MAEKIKIVKPQKSKIQDIEERLRNLKKGLRNSYCYDPEEIMEVREFYGWAPSDIEYLLKKVKSNTK